MGEGAEQRQFKQKLEFEFKQESECEQQLVQLLSTMSDEAKHRLFQAVGATKDDQLLMKVLAKIGFPNASGVGYDKFMEDHPSWAMKNFEFMDTVNTPEKGRAYVNAHIND